MSEVPEEMAIFRIQEEEYGARFLIRWTVGISQSSVKE